MMLLYTTGRQMEVEQGGKFERRLKEKTELGEGQKCQRRKKKNKKRSVKEESWALACTTGQTGTEYQVSIGGGG